MHNNASILRAFWDSAANVSLPTFSLNLVLAAFLAWLLGVVYVQFGTALSNRRLFARNFVMLAVTTTLVISIVKSSLALSLGLVGALSIVRFRAAIKDPEELAFLFLAISIGLGLGAGQPIVTLLALVIISGLLALRKLGGKPDGDGANLFLSISSPTRTVGVKQVEELLGQSGGAGNLRRFEDSPEAFEASFLVSFPSTAKLEEFSQRLRQLDTRARVSFVEDRSHGV